LGKIYLDSNNYPELDALIDVLKQSSRKKTDFEGESMMGMGGGTGALTIDDFD